MTAKKPTKHNSKPKTTKPVTKPPTATTAEPGYAGHTAGSRKGTIHELFDKEGEDVAWTRGLKVGLKQGTLRSWFAAWKRVQSKNKNKNKVETNSSTPPVVQSDGLSATSETAYP